ncbi:hypothetical protein BDW74DRAFT_106091 [Aspergillus multicolor]|uniref:uncharacterized protein n=1 Tax=Aspergillus multicolor TaxID=41759 RepID=UPI003CCD104C
MIKSSQSSLFDNLMLLNNRKGRSSRQNHEARARGHCLWKSVSNIQETRARTDVRNDLLTAGAENSAVNLAPCLVDEQHRNRREVSFRECNSVRLPGVKPSHSRRPYSLLAVQETGKYTAVAITARGAARPTDSVPNASFHNSSKGARVTGLR